MILTENAPIKVSVHRSPIDGALVVQVDTEAEAGQVRINLNDGPVWDGDPELQYAGLIKMFVGGDE